MLYEAMADMLGVDVADIEWAEWNQEAHPNEDDMDDEDM